MKYYEANLDERDGTKMWFCSQVTLPWRLCKDHRDMACFYEREEKYEIQRHGYFLGLQGSGGMEL